jgi:hypothetical protein
MKKIIKLIVIFVGAAFLVSLSPMIVKYPHTVPLVEGGPADDTITHVYSGFPIPYMHRTNLGMGMEINKFIYATDVAFTAMAIGWLMNKAKKRR